MTTGVFYPQNDHPRSFPLFVSPVRAGFPSPADDYLEGRLDLNEHLIKHPAATFFVRVTGDSMTGANITPGDLLVVDRALQASHNDIVLAILEGEFTVKRFCRRGTSAVLMPENPRYQPIIITANSDFEIWGVVIHVIHTCRRG